MTTPYYKELKWQDALPDIRKVNPDLARAIEEVNPGDECTLVKASYPWGQPILYEESFNLPSEKKGIVNIQDSSVSKRIQSLLFYQQTIPLSLALKNTCELSVEAENYRVPYMIMKPGSIFGLWPALQKPGHIYYSRNFDEVRTGARSIMLTQKASDATSYHRLSKTFNLKCSMPTAFSDQWPLFFELTNHPDFPQPWSFDVLFFTKPWLERLTDKKWLPFRVFLLNYAWQSTTFLRNQIPLNALFSKAIREKNLKPNPYLADVVKYLCVLAAGYYPGFQIAETDEMAPISALQKIFLKVYKTKYFPTILQPAYFDYYSDKALYYFLEYSTLLEFSPKSNKKPNKLNDLREIQYILKSIFSFVSDHPNEFHDSLILEIQNKLRIDFFHSSVSVDSNEIRPVEIILKRDKAALRESMENPDTPFCTSSPLFRGCVQITKKTSKNKL